ncbi:MAG: Na+/H+ antiporter subunit E [Opitutales bacterium]
MRTFSMHLLLVATWLLLSPQRRLLDLLIGVALGFLLLFLFQRVLRCEEYVRRTLAWMRFLGSFLRAFIGANLAVAGIILFRNPATLQPGFVNFPTEGMSAWELILLSHAISLTPGTTTVEILDEGKSLRIHALEAESPERVRSEIDQLLRRPLLEASRCLDDPILKPAVLPPAS